MGNNDIYFVMNQQDRTIKREISFRVTGKIPEIWNPECGSIIRPAVFNIKDDYTTLPVKLKPYQSLLFVFKNEKPVLYIQSIKQNGIQIFPAEKSSDSTDVPVITMENSAFVATSTKTEGVFNLVDNKLKKYTLKATTQKEFIISGYSGEITFNPGYTVTIQPVEFKNLQWLTESENPDIKYFSGKAKYTISFASPVDRIQQTDSIFLDIGKFESVAEIKLNGTELGYVWKPGTNLSVNGLLKKENVLEVTVANTYRNRFIGDFMQFGKIQNLWTSSPISNFLNRDLPLKPSGLKGPLRIIVISRKIIK